MRAVFVVIFSAVTFNFLPLLLFALRVNRCLEGRNLSNIQTTFLQTITPSFSGHQTFPFRYTWLKKGVDAVTADSTAFAKKDASVELGVGKNMVDSIRHWCKVSGLITARKEQLEMLGVAEKRTAHRRSGFQVTEFGKTIFGDKTEKGLDPYLEDPATLWLLHYQIVTNTELATTWHWAFNILRGNQFTPHTFAREVHKWAQQQKQSMRPVSDNTLQRDVNCFIRTYCQSRDNSNNVLTEESFDCPLVELNLIAELPESNTSTYEFQRGDKETLPIEVVTWTLDTFWKNYFSGREALSFSELMYAPSSPGRVFRLDEDTMTIYLEKLEQLTDSAFQYDETAGLKQLYRHRDFDQMELLERYYG